MNVSTWPQRKRCCCHRVLSLWIGVATLLGWLDFTKSSSLSLLVDGWTTVPRYRQGHRRTLDPNYPSHRYFNVPFRASSSSPFLHTDTCAVPIESWQSLFPTSPRTLLPKHTVEAKLPPVVVSGGCSIRIVSECSNATLERVAEFLVDAYWLGTPRVWVRHNAGSETMLARHSGIPCDNQSIRWSTRRLPLLVRQQAADLAAKFSGQSRRVAPQSFLRSTLLMATTHTDRYGATFENDVTLVGVVCLQELLLDRDRGVLLSVEESQQVLRQIWSSLPRLMQRHYASSSSMATLWSTLVSSRSPYASLVPVSVLCNLAVAPSMRRHGVARALCRAAYDAVVENRLNSSTSSSHEPQQWPMSSVSRSPFSHSPFSSPQQPRLMLKVECDNASALALYKTLGYQPYSRISNDPALRLDVAQGILVPVQVESYLLQLL
jgi:GNAT superfamily N-acetyltransferase